MSRYSLSIMAGLLAMGLIPATGAEVPEPAPAPRAVLSLTELVKQLSSEEFSEREEATRRLSELDVDKLPTELLAATRSENPEVRTRASKALAAIRWRVAGRQLERDSRFASRGAIDMFVASSATWDVKADDSRVWESMITIGKELFKKAEMQPPLHCPSSYRDLAAFRKACNPRFVKTDTLYRREEMKNPKGNVLWHYQGGIIAPEIDDPWALHHNLIISRGSVRAETRIGDSIVFATGSVIAGTHFANSVIVCDGDVETPEFITCCLVIARGNIKVKGSVSESTLIAGGSISIKLPLPTDPIGKPVLKDNVANPLGYITFFELSTVGVEAKVADKAVRVIAVAAGKPFAAAGAKVGDIITEVNGKKPDSPEALRRLLRDALAIGDATVKLQRGDKTVTVKVALPE